ncbi:MAG: hypothetical protein KUA32_10470 [Candidatus Desulforudis sp.]|nr:hypothetical protein [Desulforudis sp.]MDQ7790259.1 hypothetical protein [Clostridia bacterium]
MAPCITSGDRLGDLADRLRTACLAGDARKMESVFQEMVDVDEECADAWFGLGMLSMQDARFEDAYDFLSEFVSFAEDGEAAEDAEVLLCFLERTLSGERDVHNDLLEEVDEQFLRRHFTPEELDEPQTELGRLTVREAINTPVGKNAVLALIREDNRFMRAATERGLALVMQSVPVKDAH